MQNMTSEHGVECSVGFAQGTALKGMRFESLEEAQAHLDRRTEMLWADARIHPRPSARCWAPRVGVELLAVAHSR